MKEVKAAILTLEQVATIRARYLPQEKLGHYGLRALLLEVLDSHDALQAQLAWTLQGWTNICITRQETEADLRAVLTVLTAIPAHRDYDAHFGKALARHGVRRLLAAKAAGGS